MMPQFMPRECAESKAIEAIPMPSRWIAAIDATPGREMTLGSRKWWDDHGRPWFFTMRGVDRHMWWQQECLKRSPDDFDLYIYNDFGGYGALEVLENIVSTLYMHDPSRLD